MCTRLLVRIVLFGAFVGALNLQMQGSAATQTQTNATPDATRPANGEDGEAAAQVVLTAPKLEEIIDRFIGQEKDEIEALDHFSPIIETYIQLVKPDEKLGLVPKSDFYLLGQADFGGRLKVHSLIDGGKKGTWMCSFDPAGFLQMILIDRGQFDQLHYRFKFWRREFLGDVRCLVVDVEPAPKVRGARFVGRIWVEDQDMTIVRFNGKYSPAIHFSLKTFQDEYYLHFDSWRTNVKPGMRLPSYVYSHELDHPTPFSNPTSTPSTHLYAYKFN